MKMIKPKKNERHDPQTVEEATEAGHAFLADHSIAALRERRLLLSLRAVSIGLIANTILSLVLGFLLYSLMPLKEVRPFLVRVAEADSIAASVMPIRDTFDAKELLTEKLIREYVVNRHEILRSDAIMQERWGKNGYVGVTTDPEEYSRFAASVKKTIEGIRSEGAERRARILSVSAVRNGKVYVVDFLSQSYGRNGDLIAEKKYTATMEIEFRKLENMTKDQMMINPTGFTVVHYSLAEKED